MDTHKAAIIKVSSRLKPAKDIHVIYSNLLANKDPEQVPVLRQKMINLIDAAEIEYQLLNSEILQMENMCNVMNNEIEEMNRAIESLNEQVVSLESEKDEIGEKIAKRNHMNELKLKLNNKKNLDVVNKINEIVEDNECLQEEIDKCMNENEKRDKGLKMIIKGFNSFMLNSEEEDNHEPNENENNEKKDVK